MSTTTATTAEYSVSGMTCGHCVSSVTAEVGKLDGVTAVHVDLAAGRVTVSAAGAVDDAAVAAAVAEAGYQVVEAPKDENPGASCCGSCH